MEKQNEASSIFENVRLTTGDLFRALGGIAIDVISATRRSYGYYPVVPYEHPLDTPLEQITQWGNEEVNGQLILDFGGSDARETE